MKHTIVIIGLVVIGGIGFLMFSGESSNDPGSEGTPSTNQMNAEEGLFSGSLVDLQNRGGNYRCTFTHESEIAQSSGVIYVAGEKIRGDFESETQGISIDSHMIARDGFIYAWSPISPNGFKVPQTTNGTDADAAAQGGYADFQQNYSYDCKPWKVDESKFEIPSTEFVSITT